jgi:hypothetical protein
VPSGSGRWPQPQGRLPPRRPPRRQRPSWLVEPPAVPGQGLLALDGGYVQSHDNPEGMEGKVAVIASGRERVGRDRWRLTGRHYVASFGSAATFGPLVYQVAAESGVAQAESLVVLGDGASWITEIAA